MCALPVYTTLLLTSFKHFESPSLGRFHNQLYTSLIGCSWWAMFKFVSPHQDTPLHYAAGGGHAAIAQFLPEKGADINIKNSKGVRE